MCSDLLFAPANLFLPDGYIQTGGIKYNQLNLPTEVKFNNSTSQVIKYTYDATEVKLKNEFLEK